MGIVFLLLHRSNYIQARKQFTTTYLYKNVTSAFSIPEGLFFFSLLIIAMPGTLFCLVQNPKTYSSCMTPTFGIPAEKPTPATYTEELKSKEAARKVEDPPLMLPLFSWRQFVDDKGLCEHIM